MVEEDTCCAADIGDKLFSSLNQAFIVDPEIDEIDIIPCLHCQERQGSDQENGVVVVNHKLGIKSWCIKPLFLFAYNKLLRSRVKEGKDCSLSVTESVQLTRAVLLVNAECYTAWNARKEMICTGVLSPKDDWKFSGVVLSKHPRSAETFTHRRWTIMQLEKREGMSEFVQVYLRNELAITLRAAECYADNYTAWSHRSWLVERFMSDKKRKLFCELQGMRIWAERHVSDNCGFHYRQSLLKHLNNVCSKTEMVHLVLSELEFTTDLIWTFPGHEVVWHHRRFLSHVWDQWFADVTFETLQEIASLTRSDTNRTGRDNGKLRRLSPSIIPSLFELASSSFKILKQFNLGSKLRASLIEDVESDTSPLCTPSEVNFCDSVIAACDGPVGEIQRKCAVNYKKWISLRSTPCSIKCNGVIPDESAKTTASWH